MPGWGSPDPWLSWTEGEVGVLGSGRHCSCLGVSGEVEVPISFFACTSGEVVLKQVVVTQHKHVEK